MASPRSRIFLFLAGFSCLLLLPRLQVRPRASLSCPELGEGGEDAASEGLNPKRRFRGHRDRLPFLSQMRFFVFFFVDDFDFFFFWKTFSKPETSKAQGPASAK